MDIAWPLDPTEAERPLRVCQIGACPGRHRPSSRCEATRGALTCASWALRARFMRSLASTDRLRRSRGGGRWDGRALPRFPTKEELIEPVLEAAFQEISRVGEIGARRVRSWILDFPQVRARFVRCESWPDGPRCHSSARPSAGAVGNGASGETEIWRPYLGFVLDGLRSKSPTPLARVLLNQAQIGRAARRAP
jgi:hypothetical protein